MRHEGAGEVDRHPNEAGRRWLQAERGPSDDDPVKLLVIAAGPLAKMRVPPGRQVAKAGIVLGHGAVFALAHVWTVNPPESGGEDGGSNPQTAGVPEYDPEITNGSGQPAEMIAPPPLCPFWPQPIWTTQLEAVRSWAQVQGASSQDWIMVHWGLAQFPVAPNEARTGRPSVWMMQVLLARVPSLSVMNRGGSGKTQLVVHE
jgi:hypothetical protein